MAVAPHGRPDAPEVEIAPRDALFARISTPPGLDPYAHAHARRCRLTEEENPCPATAVLAANHEPFVLEEMGSSRGARCWSNVATGLCRTSVR
jgi:hypothetical protein